MLFVMCNKGDQSLPFRVQPDNKMNYYLSLSYCIIFNIRRTEHSQLHPVHLLNRASVGEAGL